MIQKTRGRINDFLTIDDLRKGNISQRRNPLIADLFRRIEMVEAWGRGMPLILKYAPDAIFREIGGLFIVSFGRPSFFEQPEDETALERPADNLKTILKASHKTFLAELTNKEKLVIDIIRENPTITREALAKKLDLSVGGARYNTDKLQAKGVLRRIGGKKAGRWEVLDGANK